MDPVEGRSFSPPLCLPGDMYSHDGDADEPEWVKTEREQFVEFRDKNRDGKMDKEETKDWILPSDYDHAEAEARHLVYESDQNKVGTAPLLRILRPPPNLCLRLHGSEADPSSTMRLAALRNGLARRLR